MGAYHGGMQEKAGGKRGILATIGLLFGVVTLGVARLAQQEDAEDGRRAGVGDGVALSARSDGRRVVPG